MFFNFEIGKIYDTIFFGILHFHKEAVLERFDGSGFDRNWFDKLDAELKEMQSEAGESLPPLPSILSPFFLWTKPNTCALTAYFKEKVDYARDTFDSFLENLKANPDELFVHLVDTVFPDRPFGDPSSLALPPDPALFIVALNASPYSQEIKLQISLLFGNYSYAFSLLAKHLQLIYKQIDALHNAHAKEITNAAEEMQQRRYLAQLAQIYKQMSSEAFREELPSCASVSLLNSMLFFHKSDGTYYALISGIQYEDALRFAAGRNDDWRTVFLTIGNEIRFSILDVMFERGEMTASEVSRALGISPSTAFVHMDVLFQKGILFLTRKKGMQTFYKINYPAMRHALRLAGNFLDERETGGKSEEK